MYSHILALSLSLSRSIFTSIIFLISFCFNTNIVGFSLLYAHMHNTVWGIIEDQHSFEVINKVWTLPASPKQGGKMVFLHDKLYFTMNIITLKGAEESEQEEQQTSAVLTTAET